MEYIIKLLWNILLHYSFLLLLQNIMSRKTVFSTNPFSPVNLELTKHKVRGHRSNTNVMVFKNINKFAFKNNLMVKYDIFDYI